MSINHPDFRTITVGSWQVEYLVFGSGSQTLLAFHGFDNDAEDLFVFEPSLGKQFTIIAVNLFFHGKSRADLPPEKSVFDRQQLSIVTEALLAQHAIHRFSLLGYSLGGRVCLTLIELFADRIDSVFLLAADGLKLNRWYVFITGSPFGRLLFRRVVKRPAIFIRLAAVFRKMKIIGEKQYKFALSNFDSSEKRKKVYEVWMIYRLLLPDHRKVAREIRKHKIPLHLVFGKYDSIIPLDHAVEIARDAGNSCHVHQVDTGHQLIKPWVGEFLRDNCLQ